MLWVEDHVCLKKDIKQVQRNRRRAPRGGSADRCRGPEAAASLKRSRERLRAMNHRKPKVWLELGGATNSWSSAFLLSCVFSTRVTSPSKGKRDKDS